MGFGIAQQGITKRLHLHCTFTKRLSLRSNRQKLHNNLRVSLHHPRSQKRRYCVEAQEFGKVLSATNLFLDNQSLHAGCPARHCTQDTTAQQITAPCPMPARLKSAPVCNVMCWACVWPAQGAVEETHQPLLPSTQTYL